METPKGFRIQIGILGRRNVGKSTLINLLTRQETSIVSDVLGTTTDPVEKAAELHGIGPVLFIDTAGIDDDGVLGAARVQKTYKIIEKIDIAILVVEKGIWTSFEENILTFLHDKKIPTLVIVNKIDLPYFDDINVQTNGDLFVSFNDKSTLPKILEAIQKIVPPKLRENGHVIVRDLLKTQDLVVLVIPIDKEAPEGRLILPQVQTIRDILDGNCHVLMTKDSYLADLLNKLKIEPEMVITDSSCFASVSKIVPPNIKLTSFSILFARLKGDLGLQVQGARAISKLQESSRVLISEACTHHAIEDDIGRVKIPRLMKKYLGFLPQINFLSGNDFPEDLAKYDLVIQCGSCMLNRQAVMSRLQKAIDAKVKITNYGLAISYMLGILDRAIKPFNLE